MQLVIRARSLHDEPHAQAIVCEFDARGGTIGRSDSNTMTLPDPERHVSRLQGEVVFGDNAFSIRNVGSSNPLILNGRPVGPGDLAALSDGDTLIVGRYELKIEVRPDRMRQSSPHRRAGVDTHTVIRASAGEVRTNPPRSAGRVPAKAPQDYASPFLKHTSADAAKPSVDDPFADLLESSSQALSTSAKDEPFGDLMPASRQYASKGVPQTAQATLPDDFDPFAEITPPRGASDRAALDDGMREFLAPPTNQESATLDPPLRSSQRAAQDIDNVIGRASNQEKSLDEWFGLADGSVGTLDPLGSVAPPASSDPLSMFNERMPSALWSTDPRPQVGPADADHVPELQGAYAPPKVRSSDPQHSTEPHVHRPGRSLPSPSPQSPDANALWQAFCAGAGIAMPTPQRLTPEMMQSIGATLRQAVDGTVQLIAIRTTAKQSLRSQVTTIQSKNNNPLKFAPDPVTAFKQLMGPPVRGFMNAPDAMQDAMSDLIGHAVGTMAGMHAALQGMLHRFGPAQLEAQLTRGGVLDRVVPMNRRAKLWELYLQHHDHISESAREDFHEVFGKAFVKAYEEEADRIAEARRKQT